LARHGEQRLRSRSKEELEALIDKLEKKLEKLTKLLVTDKVD